MKVSTCVLSVLVAYAQARTLQSQHQAVQAVQSIVGHFTSCTSNPVATKTAKCRYLNEKTRRFFVDGTSIPEVNFDVGESYAGLLQKSSSSNSSLFFWFFPSKNPQASDDVTIWLNGGPGDSSMNGMLLGHGPFLWQPGTQKPVPNPYAWANLTNVVYVDQPAGTGFSPSSGDVKDVIDVAEQFASWYKNFVETFGLEGRKVYITGESYAGHMIPYIASRMLDDQDRTHFNVRGIQLIDSVINSYVVLQQAPAAAMLTKYQKSIGLNDTFVSEMNERAEKCGYTAFLAEALTYPPPKDFLAAPHVDQPGCGIWSHGLKAAFEANPCFNVYHLTDVCPSPKSVMQDGPGGYFNRPDVQRLLHVPKTDFKAHAGFAWGGFPGIDALGPQPSALGPLRSVIERTNNTMISHGWLDYLLSVNGTLATIQNMTWNGEKGFQKAPVEPFWVPHEARSFDEGTAGNNSAVETGMGVQGTAHTERGLTFVSINAAGHEMPRYTPAAAYRQLEFLLGRIKQLNVKS
ncbi:hypothetical protein QQS21_006769 [Conoideocrella luteorostrata]|uniref:Carboxypeptidase n=1 Tax=Conoideocrella luteorostrata TaxID=1105319 RepID=A0AAJ0CM36_9HYPO|nr:hypothetical protein QQS21_006769 [Conoideocrella luteorostrata]